jgi:trans-aconitate 2-methyltransferase
LSLSDPSLKPWDAKDYQKTFSYVWKAAEDLIELLGPQKDEHILDLGCGTAELTAKIAASGAQVMGLDASAEMIALARQKFPSLKFVQADVREVMSPLDGSSVFSPHSFDAVFSNATLHWVLEPERVIQGVVKLLKPGGRFVTEFGGQGNLLFLHKALDESFRLVTKKEPPSLWYFPSISGYTSLV